VRVLLHACCGPCLLEPFDALEEHEVDVLFANPNIAPAEEYARRRDTLKEHAEAHGIAWSETPYEPSLWGEAVAGVEQGPGERCARCFLLRMRITASAAAASGYDAFATTLTVSPYQDQDAVRAAALSAAEDAGVDYFELDVTARYQEATRRSRELGMYRQRYCGCEPSISEAEETRRRRREERRAGSRYTTR
jgi:predicted adenine nucleotide alpha hydrolase (AANH) superfamily ATPase